MTFELPQIYRDALEEGLPEGKNPDSLSNEYLEEVIIEALHENGITDAPKQPIFYTPSQSGGLYRPVRRWLAKNSTPLGLLGVVASGAAAYSFPEFRDVAMGGAAIGAAATLAPLDKWLFGNQIDVAEREFMNLQQGWYKTYSSIEITGKKSLDRHVYMARTANALVDRFPDPDSAVAIGISVGKTADVLSEASGNGGRDLDISESKILGYLKHQKIKSDTSRKAIEPLFAEHSIREVRRYLRHLRSGSGKSIERIPKNHFEGVGLLDDLLQNHQMALRVEDISINSAAAKMSSGRLVIGENAGPNLASYAGEYSLGLEYPRIRVKGDTQQSALTHAKRVYSWFGGDVDQELLEGATGGIAVVEGIIENKVVSGATDKDWPLMVVSADGIKSHLHNIDDGLVISLNGSHDISRLPEAYLFRGHKMKEIELGGGNVLAKAAHLGRAYIKEWKERHPNFPLVV